MLVSSKPSLQRKKNRSLNQNSIRLVKLKRTVTRILKKKMGLMAQNLTTKEATIKTEEVLAYYIYNESLGGRRQLVVHSLDRIVQFHEIR